MEQQEIQEVKEIADSRVRREEEFPNDPEKRFEVVFSAIGNSEAKCVTLLCLSQNPIGLTDLHRQFLEKSKHTWQAARQLPAAYCKKSLIPIGLVAEADTLYYGSTDYIAGFRLTEAGQKYGQPIAAYLLEKSASLDHSLLKVFGPTTKGRGENRTVLIRAKILEQLADSEFIRTLDISRNTRIDPHVVRANLSCLADLKFVNYSYADPERRGQHTYSLTNNAQREEVQPVRNDSRLTAEIADLLFNNGKIESNQLFEFLRDKFPGRSEFTLRNHIFNTISGLRKQGVCEPDLYHRWIQSKASITNDGRRLVSELILPIKQALGGNEDLLSTWRTIPWQNYAKDAVLKYKEASGYAAKRPMKEWTERALSIISENPGIRPHELNAQLGRSSGELLRILSNKGDVRKEKQGMAVRYYPIDRTSQNQSILSINR